MNGVAAGISSVPRHRVPSDFLMLAYEVANALSGNIGNSSSMSAFLAESAKAAFSVSGAIDADQWNGGGERP